MPGLLTGYDPRSTSSYAAISGVSDSGLKLIENSQLQHPEYYSRGLSDAVNDFADSVKQGLNDFTVDNSDSSSPPRFNYPSSASGVASKPKKSKKLSYTNADIAKMYGMSRSTAYQEALANTSYQRAVKDMQTAGLNPSVLFGAGRATPASASVYASEGSSSSGGGYGRRSGSGSNGKLFSGSAYSAIQAIGGLIGIATTKRPDGFWIGSQTAKGAMGLLDSVWKK